MAKDGRKHTSSEHVPSAHAPRRIQALEQDVVNKIAAGEIIVAPVHALKELTENAVDAGATSVEILVKEGGLKLLQITDNGHGINRDDLPILCERFTTSKIKAFEDLASIGTYGFRGEALASISHIAHLRITTRTKESSCAWQAHYSSGKLVPPKPSQSADPKPCAGRQGTQITVEDLFYNIPTRRRAFRSASEEYTKILDLVGKYAIHCSNVAFTCKKHGDASVGISVQANATVVDRIRNIHGTAVANELIPFASQSDRWGFKADGHISNANYHVKKLTLLLFINHRAVESSSLKRAIEQTYSAFLPKGTHPFVYLSLEIEPHRVDVNVHPTKREVNFLNEDEIIDCICDDMRTALGKVDTSRTYMTQSLLPGVKIPTISLASPSKATPRKQVTNDKDSDDDDSNNNNESTVETTASSTKRTPATKPHESNLVRTDAKARKITSMLLPARKTARSPIPAHQNPESGTNESNEIDQIQVDSNSMQYTYSEREPTTCRLISVKNLRATVRDEMHQELTESLSSHTFVGIIDERRRLAAIQSGVKLYLVDYGMLANEYFYQLGLTDFANFGSIKFDPPLSLRDLLRIGALREQEIARQQGDEETLDLDWEEVVTAVEDQLISRNDMLAEYFSLEVSDDGLLLRVPLLIKGYMPSMAKLPRFLLRLGPHVDWLNEQDCFHSFLRELASWYVPEALPPSPAPQPSEKQLDKDSDTPMSDSPLNEGLNRNEGDSNQAGKDENEDPDLVGRRNELNKAVENVLFPAFKSRLIATKGMTKGIVEIADLKGLYRVFERC